MTPVPDFDEFLRGTCEAQLADPVVQRDRDLIHSFRDRLVDLLRLYTYAIWPWVR